MKRIIYILLLAVTMQPAFSQVAFQTVLDSVAANNKTLTASRQYYDVQKIDSKTGIYLANPSVSCDRLNNPSGSYTEFVISQSFDFPTAYFHKSKIANLSVLQADERFRQSKLDVLTSTAQVYAELVSQNRIIAILEKREQMANQLQTSIEKKLQLGDANVFEVNRVRSELAKVQSEKNIAQSRQKSLLLKLAELNGDIGLVVNDTIFPDLAGMNVSDPMMNELVIRNPQLKQWETQKVIAQQNIDLQKSLSLPKFEVGYRQDANTGQSFKGFHAGITIPLFENKNTVRSAKARQVYTAEATDAYKLSLQNSLEQLYSEFQAVQQSVFGLNKVYKTLNTPVLLVKAYNSGQINYTTFFAEYDNYRQTALYIEDLNSKATSLQLQIYVLSNY
jgi:cobalt-zinc-cadmium efflux system outer membrane protein